MNVVKVVSWENSIQDLFSKYMPFQTGPPRSKVSRFNSLRCRTMKWQLEDNYHWSIVFTDRMSDTAPMFIDPNGTFVMFNQTNFGNNLNAQGPNGPN